jgi:transcriptional regulator with XRE-family HTH domain
MTPWAEYVIRTSGTDVSTDIASATGIAQSSVYRWLHKEASPSTAHAARFAQTYGRQVLEAFVAAEFLTPEQAGVEVVAPTDVRSASSGELLRELERRIFYIDRYRSNTRLGLNDSLLSEIRTEYADLTPNSVERVRYALGDLAGMLSMRFAGSPEHQTRALETIRRIATEVEYRGGASDHLASEVVDWCEHFADLATAPSFSADDFLQQFEATRLSEVAPSE